MAGTSLPQRFDVSIRDPNGRPQVINVNSSMTVREVKEVFAQRVHLDVNQFRLVFAGQQLNDASRLEVVLTSLYVVYLLSLNQRCMIIIFIYFFIFLF